MSDVAIKITGVGKRYCIGAREPYYALRDIIAGTLRVPFRPKSKMTAASSNEVWAVKDISLEIKKGEILGIVGSNGAGKSTLLKILSRVTEPTEGHAEIQGRVGSLLEVGVGFHPELTGRENVYLNGAIIGMRKSEIDRQFDAIVDFSGVEKFIDTPVKRFSSGMYVRLAFSVAAHLHPEILLVDEVLAVGDFAFQKKCIDKVSAVAHSGRTVLFVSHNMSAIRNLCTSAVHLEQGRIKTIGLPENVIQQYLQKDDSQVKSTSVSLKDRHDRSGSGAVRAVDIKVSKAGDPQAPPQSGTDTHFEISYDSSSKQSLFRLRLVLNIVDTNGSVIFSCGTHYLEKNGFLDAPPRGKIVCLVKRLPLIPGKYWMNLAFKDDHGITDMIDRAGFFEVVDSGETGYSSFPAPKHGHVIVSQTFKLVLPSGQDFSQVIQ
ncbi:MAG: ABC transporter ATP-binding protein [Candidatus Omnitrophica bacterium CG11_big_fil_rev_8_21_14_0_20_45_26]|uniref:ABC transporter ATP-binding protein n=1 Tax=Candidatus Abzuiibacterium crystallinum TaxID=1974748 RepID=A0A2H0LQY6_9BACT|nr:MAG: ABC transporter ATP-binding protein [Candidatus Omnitrophica bacterium CG11_big_fil_rev_8_21_14_0_20_45_26]PIW64679.1 MAG: ABC transporter ATP-binding protein [Candidatus Omnitrophica bacterium CG12_big_fil_rev_8_21_14_0_65_45_16]